jgi:hypothetical protein
VYSVEEGYNANVLPYTTTVGAPVIQWMILCLGRVEALLMSIRTGIEIQRTEITKVDGGIRVE